MNKENRISAHFGELQRHSWGGIPQPCGTTPGGIRDHRNATYFAIEDDTVVADRVNDRAAISPVAAAQQVRSLFRIKQLEICVEELQREIRELRTAIAEKVPQASPKLVSQDPSILEVVLATERLFNGPIKIETLCDPSDGDTEMVMLTVQTRDLTFDQIIDLQLEWNRIVLAAQPGYSGQLRLQVVPST